MSNKLTIVNDNYLRYEGKTLWADVLPIPYGGAQKDQYLPISPRELETILRVGHTMVEHAIEDFYHEQYACRFLKGFTAPTRPRPSIWVAQLGSNSQTDTAASKVYSEAGYANGGVHWKVEEQKPEFEQHWIAVERAGFHTHVRGSNDGAFLMLRNDQEQ